jgi:hypothetical protein
MGAVYPDPFSGENAYVFNPLWLSCGICAGKFEINEDIFDSSLQGSIFEQVVLWAQKRTAAKGYKFSADQWYVMPKSKNAPNCVIYRNGVVELYTIPTDKEYHVVDNSDFCKLGFYVTALSRIKEYTKIGLKSFNQMNIAKFAGCGVTMKSAAWRMELSQLPEMTKAEDDL